MFTFFKRHIIFSICKAIKTSRPYSVNPDNFHLAQRVIKHIDSLDTETHVHFFKLKEIQADLQKSWSDFQDVRQMANDTDPELAALAKKDLSLLDMQLKEKLKLSSRLLLTSSWFDHQDAFLEVTAGAGGLEAGVLAYEIQRFYQGYCQSLGFDIQVLESEDYPVSSSLKSIQRSKLSVQGLNVFRTLKYECGVHRVQRVPSTGTKSDRLQTSTCSLAVYPKPDEDDIAVEEKDLKIEYMRSSGKGGQNVNKTDSCCRITHLPSGFAVKVQEERFQVQNERKARRYIKEMLYNAKYEAEMAALNRTRKSQVGNMDRNEKIRSYNYNRNAITEHRLGEVKTVPDIASFLQGANGYGILNEWHQKLEDIELLDAIKDLS